MCATRPNQHEMRPNQSLKSEGNAPIETEPMIKNTANSSIGCNGMPANDEDYHGLQMYKNHAKGLNHRGMYATRPNQHEMRPNQSLKSQGNAPIECRQRLQQQQTPLYRQAAAAHHGTQRISAQLSEDANHQVLKAYSPMAATSPPWIPC